MHRKRLVEAACLIFFGLWPASLRAGTVLWSDGFETGDFSAWTAVSGNWAVVTSSLSAHSGLRGADITEATNPAGDVLTLQASSLGYENLQFDYWSKVRAGLETEDQVLVEMSTNGGVDWIPLDTYSNVLAGDWQARSFNLPVAADNNPDLSLRLWAKLSSSGDRMNFDDFSLSGQPVPEPATLGLLVLGALTGVRRYRRR